MAGKIEICNWALSDLNLDPITNIDDPADKVATKCKLFYQHTIDTCLRAHPWNCATYRRTLTPDSEAPDFDWSEQFTLPKNPHCLRVVGLDDPNYKWTVSGRKLLANIESANIVYIGRPTVTDIDPLLVEVISKKLAVNLCTPLAQSKTLKRELREELLIVAGDAKTVDAQEASVIDINDEAGVSEWMKAFC